MILTAGIFILAVLLVFSQVSCKEESDNTAEDIDDLLESVKIAGRTVELNKPNEVPGNAEAAVFYIYENEVSINLPIEIVPVYENVFFMYTKTTSLNDESNIWFSPGTQLAFSDNDILIIRVICENGKRFFYRILIRTFVISDAVTVSGTYSLGINSDFPQQLVVIEAVLENGLIVNSVQADITNSRNGTWSLLVPVNQPLFFRITVTDITGFSFGRIVTNNALVYQNNTFNVPLSLGPYEPPLINSFVLTNADASGGVKRNKTGTINQATGIISFANTSFNTISVNTIIDFHRLSADFSISQGSKLYVDDIEQKSGVSVNNYNQEEIVFTVIAEDNARKIYRINGRSSGSTSIVGTTSWQTQGFGVLYIETTDKSLGITGNTKLNLIWNPTGTFTYISPDGKRSETGRTDIRGRGNYSWRGHTNKSYAIRFNQPVGIDYYDWKNDKFITLPAHRRFQLLAHEGDSSRLRTPLAHEMGRHVLTHMGWQPHSDWVFFFLNGRYMGVYMITEAIRPDADRMNLLPLASETNRNGGIVIEINNTRWYGLDINGNNSTWMFEDRYNFMSSHQVPVRNTSGSGGSTGDFKMQGIVFSMSEPDSRLGWYESDPPDGTGNLSFSNNAHAVYFPRKAFALAATLNTRGQSKPASEWIVANDFGQPNGIGTSGLLIRGTAPYGQDGGMFGSRTLAQVYPGFNSSTFVHIAQFIQNAEDAIYARNWGTNGTGGYHNFIDIDSFIDFHIAMEMTSNWEIQSLNGFYMYFCPAAQKLKMGPLWDMDNGWNRGDRNTLNGHVKRTGFWYKELMGWEMTGTTPDTITQGIHRRENMDPYYATRLSDRWRVVGPQMNSELNLYLERTNARFSRITGFSHPFGINGDRLGFRGRISTRVTDLNTVMEGYRP